MRLTYIRENTLVTAKVVNTNPSTKRELSQRWGLHVILEKLQDKINSCNFVFKSNSSGISGMKNFEHFIIRCKSLLVITTKTLLRKVWPQVTTVQPGH